MAFWDLMFDQCRPAEAIERDVGDSCTQHDARVADGKQAFIDDFERLAREVPGQRVHFKRAVAESDLIVLHRHPEWPTSSDKDWAGIDIFRFDARGRIVEPCDVLQVVPQESAHANTMFWRRPGGNAAIADELARAYGARVRERGRADDDRRACRSLRRARTVGSAQARRRPLVAVARSHWL